MSAGRVRSKSGLNLREKPNGRKLSVLRSNEEIEILDEVRFFRVKTAGGVTGYVHGDYVDESPKEDEVLPDTLQDDEFPTPEFTLVKYKGEHFIGRDTMVDQDFVAALNRVNRYAGECGVRIWVTSSTRNINQQVKGAIVPPASRSCHHVGHAIDMNIQFNGKLYNSKKMLKSNHSQLPKMVVKFIDLIRQDSELRWGGDFRTQDPVHIDDNLFRRQEMIYLAKLQSRVAQLNA